MVKGIHLRITESHAFCVGVPALPYSSCARFYLIQPGRLLVLKQKIISHIRMTVVGKDGGDYIGAQESGSQRIFAVICADAGFIRILIADIFNQKLFCRLFHFITVIVT